MPRVSAGAKVSDVCPTRQLVLDTPQSVRWEMWEFKDGCASVAEAFGNKCALALDGSACEGRARAKPGGCRLQQCGKEVPCCVHYMPAAAATKAAEAHRYHLYWSHVGRHYETSWSLERLIASNVLTTKTMRYSELPPRLRW